MMRGTQTRSARFIAMPPQGLRCRYGQGEELKFCNSQENIVISVYQKKLIGNVLLFGILVLSVGPIFADEISSVDDTSVDTGPSIETGYTHESGTYGTHQQTRVGTIPLSAYYDTENFEFEATVPYVRITGPAGAIAGRVRHVASGTRPIVTSQGVGDSTLGVTRDLVKSDKTGLDWDIGGTIKLATGDVHQGLGTGANDYALFTDLSETIRRFTLTATAGYTWFGSKGKVMVNGYLENLQFKDAAYGSLGGSFRIRGRTTIGLTYFAQEPIEKRTPQEDLTGYLALGLGQRADLNLYILKGFTNASPDKGYGATVRVYF